jgi:tRNA (cmo5U34)-methyltransferase
VLDVGTGTGAIALALADEAGADVVGLDSSDDALSLARENAHRTGLEIRLLRGDLRDGLPPGPFDLVVSVLAVHHLDADGKRDLFARIAQVTDFFVLGDVVVPERPEDAVVEIDWVEDLPSSVPEQLGWLDEAGFDAEASYVRPDLAVFVARRRPR